MTVMMASGTTEAVAARRPRSPRRPRPLIEELPLEMLVGLALDGDQPAWREIERRYRQMARGVAHRAGVRPADIPDVLQHVWLQLFLSLPNLREPAYLAAWIRTTTSRESTRLLQRQQRVVLADDVETVNPAPRDTRDAVDELLVRHDVGVQVRRSARNMTDRGRQLLGVLLADPTSSYQEIADELGWPMGSVGPTRARCFQALRRLGHVRPLEA
jgi:RNA polymerase sigma factor (sigma-70 family)